MIKAAFFDIDGTLLSFKPHRVSEGTIRAFNRLHACGVRTFLSTGRPMVLVPKMPVSFEAYITMNGALVFTPEPSHKVLLSSPVPDADYQAWLDYAERNGLCTMVFTESGMMLAQPNEVGMKLRDQLEFEMPPVVTISEMRHAEAFQIIALMPANKDAEVAGFMPQCRLPRWHPAFTDIVNETNSKSHGMEAICNHYGISQDETIAFGDGGNDIDMLRWAGVGIAMGNASQDVKDAADMVTTSVDEEGIEKAIETIL